MAEQLKHFTKYNGNRKQTYHPRNATNFSLLDNKIMA